MGKTKFMLFIPTRKYDFFPNLEVNGTNLETKEEMKLLGLRNDLSLKSNTDIIVQRAKNRLWMIKRLKRQRANLDILYISDAVVSLNSEFRIGTLNLLKGLSLTFREFKTPSYILFWPNTILKDYFNPNKI